MVSVKCNAALPQNRGYRRYELKRIDGRLMLYAMRLIAPST